MAPVSVNEARSKPYDVIIVGGGTAGLVVAARLSEISNKRILVIEAGADRRGDPNIDIPGLLFGICGDPDYDWNFWTLPQSHIGGRQLSMPRGKVLGGSSAINATIMVQPSPRDFESWTNLGNHGWSPDDMAPYLQKYQTLHNPSEETRKFLSLDSYTGTPTLNAERGPLAVSYSDTYGPIHQAFQKAFDSLGFSEKTDPSLGVHQGAFSPPNSIDPRSHQRSYAATAYYTGLAEGRDNLDLLTQTLVNRIIVRRIPGRNLVEATGVEVHDVDGSVIALKANEVILSAGAIHSPLLLEKSGIGMPSILEKQGIEVLVDSPGVGENLQDHPFTSISLEAADGVVSTDSIGDATIIDAIVKEYNDSRTGPLSGVALSVAFVPPVDQSGRMSTNGIRHLLATNSRLSNIEDHSCADTTYKSRAAHSSHIGALSAGNQAQQAELEDITLDPAQNSVHFIIPPRQMNVKPDANGKSATAQSLSQTDPRNFITFFVGLNRPFSRGSVHLRVGATEKDLTPDIDPCVLSHPLDLEFLARAVAFVDTIAAQDSMRVLLKPDGDRLPANAARLEGDLETVKNVTRERLWSSFHPSSTCSMMPMELGGVVNDRLVVHGTTNVRIIDASIFPLIPMGNLQAVVYAVAERASDLIKEDWLSKLSDTIRCPNLSAAANQNGTAQDRGTSKEHETVKSDLPVLFFDIDNCLYPRSKNVHDLMAAAIDRYFHHRLGVTQEEAKKLHDEYDRDYGLALTGLIRHHKIDPLDFNTHVDDALSLEGVLVPDASLRTFLEAIDTSKVRLWLLTNAYKNHAIRVVKLLGVDDLFEGLTYCDYKKIPLMCKPQPAMYMKAMKEAGVASFEKCFFVDDSYGNCRGARDVGWTAYHLVEDGQPMRKTKASQGQIGKLQDLQDVQPGFFRPAIKP